MTTAEFMRRRKLATGPVPAAEHMPFAGHRTQETIRLQRESKVNARARAYGFDPEALAK